MIDHVTYDEQQYEERMRRYDEIFEMIKARAYGIIENVTISTLKERYGEKWRVVIEQLLQQQPPSGEADYVGVLMDDLYTSITTAMDDFPEAYIDIDLIIDEIGYDYPFIAEWLRAL